MSFMQGSPFSPNTALKSYWTLWSGNPRAFQPFGGYSPWVKPFICRGANSSGGLSQLGQQHAVRTNEKRRMWGNLTHLQLAMTVKSRLNLMLFLVKTLLCVYAKGLLGLTHWDLSLVFEPVGEWPPSQIALGLTLAPFGWRWHLLASGGYWTG